MINEYSLKINNKPIVSEVLFAEHGPDILGFFSSSIQNSCKHPQSPPLFVI